MTKMILGLRTAAYHVDDMERAKSWYTSIIGHGPYFDEPFYVGYNVGGYELGLLPSESDKAECVTVYWGVENAQQSLQRLLELGGTKHEDVQDVGGGIKVATVKDPFGNVFGIIENPHFKLQ
jgi:predicted enzyme related to lactoylglutathione lyase